MTPTSDQHQHHPTCGASGACADSTDPPTTADAVGTLLAFVLAGSALLVAIVLLGTSLS